MAFSHKVQLTREEFMRQLPDALGQLPFDDKGDRIVVDREGNQRIVISLKDLGIEEKGSLDLPMQEINFSFENMADDDVEAFMRRWEEHKLRMGG